jgi:PST family polysaccharide transporter
MTKTYSYEDQPRGSGGASVRHNAVALIGRQVITLAFAMLLARILGPSAYGIVAQANVYIAFTGLLMDQGLAASLVSKRAIDSKTVGAASGLNLLLAIALFALTWAFADPVARFLEVPELDQVLPVLAGALILKALGAIPRMLLSRQLRFGAIAVAEISSALIGGIAGVIVAMTGGDYWSIVVQSVVSDFVVMLLLLIASRPPLPNLRLGLLREVIGFSAKVFAGNVVNYSVRNVDNLLVGKYLGATQLGYYALAFRVLVIPTQMIGQTVTRVLFPAIARVQDDLPEVSRLMIKSARTIALTAFPLMALVAVSAPDLVLVVLGEAWLPAVPVLAVLAVAGARQTVASTTTSMMLGVGRSGLQLWFGLVQAAVQITSIVIGLQFGIFGVAMGILIGGLLLMPVLFIIQKRLIGTTYGEQLGAMLPAAIASALGAVPYAALHLVEMPAIVRLVIGILLFGAVYALVIRLVFPTTWRLGLVDVLTVIPIPRRK